MAVGEGSPVAVGDRVVVGETVSVGLTGIVGETVTVGLTVAVGVTVGVGETPDSVMLALIIVIAGTVTAVELGSTTMTEATAGTVSGV